MIANTTPIGIEAGNVVTVKDCNTILTNESIIEDMLCNTFPIYESP